MRLLNFTILVIIYFTLVSCETKMIDLDLTIVTNSKLAESPDEPLPPLITDLLNPIECKVNDTVYIPHITIQRTDLAEENYVIENPISAEGKTRKFLNTYAYADLKNDYEEIIPTLKTGDYISKTGSKESTTEFNPTEKNSLIYFLSENKIKKKGHYMNIKEIRSNLDSLLCVDESNSRKKIYIILSNAGSIPPIDSIGSCNQTTVTDGLDLKDDLMKIVDTKRSYKERDQLARETWKKYFDPMASVKMYLKPTEKYPDFWESGDGQNYLIDRLAYKSSITDINIIRIEYHKENSKISAITTVECHNASEVQ